MSTMVENACGDKPTMEPEAEAFFCDRCGGEFELCDLTDFDGEQMCDECLDEYTFVCWDCQNRFRNGDWYEYQHGWLCVDCYDYHYNTCEQCGTVIHNENAHYPEDDDNSGPYCADCFEERERQGWIKPYSYKPVPVFYGAGVYYGMELEIDEGGECRENARRLLEIGNQAGEHIYCKRDSSLHDGFEIVSHPMSLAYHFTQMPWKAVMDEAVKLGYRSHDCDTSGLHIHVGRKEFGGGYEEREDDIARIVFFIEKHWENMLRFIRRTESQINQWASRYGCKENPKATLENDKDSNLGRYVCLNLENRDTIEFRLFRGTLRYDTFAASLQLVDEICRAALNLTGGAFQAM